jgi:exopolysaccharide production protein ExoQ
VPKESTSSTHEAPAAQWPFFVRAIEVLLAIFCLSIFSEGFAKLIDPSVTSFNPDGSALGRALFFPAYVVGIIGLAANWERALAAAIRMPFLCAIIALVFASTFWSVMPDLTIRRAVALLMTTFFAIYLAVRFEWRRLVEIIAATYLLLAMLSVVLALVFPSLGVMNNAHAGAWSGLFVEKNALGGHMARGLAFGLMALFLVPKRAFIWAPMCLLLIGLVLLSTSKTALIGMLLVLGIIFSSAGLTRHPAIAALGIWGCLTLAGVILAISILMPELLFGLIGRDATLTGRTEIWAALQQYLQARPLFGYGYGGFWIQPLGPAFLVRELLEWKVPNAHNGWLETQLALGVVGLAVMAAAFAQTLAQSLSFAMRWPVGPCMIAYLAAYALFSVSESMVLQHNNLTWILFVVIATKVALPPNHKAPALK